MSSSAWWDSVLEGGSRATRLGGARAVVAASPIHAGATGAASFADEDATFERASINLTRAAATGTSDLCAAVERQLGIALGSGDRTVRRATLFLLEFDKDGVPTPNAVALDTQWDGRAADVRHSVRVSDSGALARLLRLQHGSSAASTRNHTPGSHAGLLSRDADASLGGGGSGIRPLTGKAPDIQAFSGKGEVAAYLAEQGRALDARSVPSGALVAVLRTAFGEPVGWIEVLADSAHKTGIAAELADLAATGGHYSGAWEGKESENAALFAAEDVDRLSTLASMTASLVLLAKEAENGRERLRGADLAVTGDRARLEAARASSAVSPWWGATATMASQRRLGLLHDGDATRSGGLHSVMGAILGAKVTLQLCRGRAVSGATLPPVWRIASAEPAPEGDKAVVDAVFGGSKARIANGGVTDDDEVVEDQEFELALLMPSAAAASEGIARCLRLWARVAERAASESEDHTTGSNARKAAARSDSTSDDEDDSGVDDSDSDEDDLDAADHHSASAARPAPKRPDDGSQGPEDPSQMIRLLLHAASTMAGASGGSGFHAHGLRLEAPEIGKQRSRVSRGDTTGELVVLRRSRKQVSKASTRAARRRWSVTSLDKPSSSKGRRGGHGLDAEAASDSHGETDGDMHSDDELDGEEEEEEDDEYADQAPSRPLRSRSVSPARSNQHQSTHAGDSTGKMMVASVRIMCLPPSNPWAACAVEQDRPGGIGSLLAGLGQRRPASDEAPLALPLRGSEATADGSRRPSKKLSKRWSHWIGRAKRAMPDGAIAAPLLLTQRCWTLPTVFLVLLPKTKRANRSQSADADAGEDAGGWSHVLPEQSGGVCAGLRAAGAALGRFVREAGAQQTASRSSRRGVTELAETRMAAACLAFAPVVSKHPSKLSAAAGASHGSSDIGRAGRRGSMFGDADASAGAAAGAGGRRHSLEELLTGGRLPLAQAAEASVAGGAGGNAMLFESPMRSRGDARPFDERLSAVVREASSALSRLCCSKSARSRGGIGNGAAGAGAGGKIVISVVRVGEAQAAAARSMAASGLDAGGVSAGGARAFFSQASGDEPPSPTLALQALASPGQAAVAVAQNTVSGAGTTASPSFANGESRRAPDDVTADLLSRSSPAAIATAIMELRGAEWGICVAQEIDGEAGEVLETSLWDGFDDGARAAAEAAGHTGRLAVLVTMVSGASSADGFGASMSHSAPLVGALAIRAGLLVREMALQWEAEASRPLAEVSKLAGRLTGASSVAEVAILAREALRAATGADVADVLVPLPQPEGISDGMTALQEPEAVSSIRLVSLSAIARLTNPAAVAASDGNVDEPSSSSSSSSLAWMDLSDAAPIRPGDGPVGLAYEAGEIVVLAPEGQGFGEASVCGGKENPLHGRWGTVVPVMTDAVAERRAMRAIVEAAGQVAEEEAPSPTGFGADDDDDDDDGSIDARSFTDADVDAAALNASSLVASNQSAHNVSILDADEHDTADAVALWAAAMAGTAANGVQLSPAKGLEMAGHGLEAALEGEDGGFASGSVVACAVTASSVSWSPTAGDEAAMRFVASAVVRALMRIGTDSLRTAGARIWAAETQATADARVALARADAADSATEAAHARSEAAAARAAAAGSQAEAEAAAQARDDARADAAATAATAREDIDQARLETAAEIATVKHECAAEVSAAQAEAEAAREAAHAEAEAATAQAEAAIAASEAHAAAAMAQSHAEAEATVASVRQDTAKLVSDAQSEAQREVLSARSKAAEAVDQAHRDAAEALEAAAVEAEKRINEAVTEAVQEAAAAAERVQLQAHAVATAQLAAERRKCEMQLRQVRAEAAATAAESETAREAATAEAAEAKRMAEEAQAALRAAEEESAALDRRPIDAASVASGLIARTPSRVASIRRIQSRAQVARRTMSRAFSMFLAHAEDDDVDDDEDDEEDEEDVVMVRSPSDLALSPQHQHQRSHTLQRVETAASAASFVAGDISPGFGSASVDGSVPDRAEMNPSQGGYSDDDAASGGSGSVLVAAPRSSRRPAAGGKERKVSKMAAWQSFAVSGQHGARDDGEAEAEAMAQRLAEERAAKAASEAEAARLAAEAEEAAGRAVSAEKEAAAAVRAAEAAEARTRSSLLAESSAKRAATSAETRADTAERRATAAEAQARADADRAKQLEASLRQVRQELDAAQTAMPWADGGASASSASASHAASPRGGGVRARLQRIQTATTAALQRAVAAQETAQQAAAAAEADISARAAKASEVMAQQERNDAVRATEQADRHRALSAARSPQPRTGSLASPSNSASKSALSRLSSRVWGLRSPGQSSPLSSPPVISDGGHIQARQATQSSSHGHADAAAGGHIHTGAVTVGSPSGSDGSQFSPQMLGGTKGSFAELVETPDDLDAILGDMQSSGTRRGGASGQGSSSTTRTGTALPTASYPAAKQAAAAGAGRKRFDSDSTDDFVLPAAASTLGRQSRSRQVHVSALPVDFRSPVESLCLRAADLAVDTRSACETALKSVCGAVGAQRGAVWTVTDWSAPAAGGSSIAQQLTLAVAVAPSRYAGDAGAACLDAVSLSEPGLRRVTTVQPLAAACASLVAKAAQSRAVRVSQGFRADAACDAGVDAPAGQPSSSDPADMWMMAVPVMASLSPQDAAVSGPSLPVHRVGAEVDSALAIPSHMERITRHPRSDQGIASSGAVPVEVLIGVLMLHGVTEQQPIRWSASAADAIALASSLVSPLLLSGAVEASAAASSSISFDVSSRQPSQPEGRSARDWSAATGAAAGPSLLRMASRRGMEASSVTLPPPLCVGERMWGHTTAAWEAARGAQQMRVALSPLQAEAACVKALAAAELEFQMALSAARNAAAAAAVVCGIMPAVMAAAAECSAANRAASFARVASQDDIGEVSPGRAAPQALLPVRCAVFFVPSDATGVAPAAQALTSTSVRAPWAIVPLAVAASTPGSSISTNSLQQADSLKAAARISWAGGSSPRVTIARGEGAVGAAATGGKPVVIDHSRINHAAAYGDDNDDDSRESMDAGAASAGIGRPHPALTTEEAAALGCDLPSLRSAISVAAWPVVLAARTTSQGAVSAVLLAAVWPHADDTGQITVRHQEESPLAASGAAAFRRASEAEAKRVSMRVAFQESPSSAPGPPSQAKTLGAAPTQLHVQTSSRLSRSATFAGSNMQAHAALSPAASSITAPKHTPPPSHASPRRSALRRAGSRKVMSSVSASGSGTGRGLLAESGSAGRGNSTSPRFQPLKRTMTASGASPSAAGGSGWFNTGAAVSGSHSAPAAQSIQPWSEKATLASPAAGSPMSDSPRTGNVASTSSSAAIRSSAGFGRESAAAIARASALFGSTMELVNDEASRAVVRAAAITDSAVIRTRAEVQLRHSVTAALQAGASAAPAVELLNRLVSAVASVDQSVSAVESAFGALFGKDCVQVVRIAGDATVPAWLPATTHQRARAIHEAVASGSDIPALFGQGCNATAHAVTILDADTGIVWGAVTDPLSESRDDDKDAKLALLVVKAGLVGPGDAGDTQHGLNAGAQVISTLLQVWRRGREAAAAAEVASRQEQAAEHRHAAQAAEMSEVQRAGSVWGRVASVIQSLSTASDEAAITAALSGLGRAGVTGWSGRQLGDGKRSPLLHVLRVHHDAEELVMPAGEGIIGAVVQRAIRSRSRYAAELVPFVESDSRAHPVERRASPTTAEYPAWAIGAAVVGDIASGETDQNAVCVCIVVPLTREDVALAAKPRQQHGHVMELADLSGSAAAGESESKHSESDSDTMVAISPSSAAEQWESSVKWLAASAASSLARCGEARRLSSRLADAESNLRDLTAQGEDSRSAMQAATAGAAEAASIARATCSVHRLVAAGVAVAKQAEEAAARAVSAGDGADMDFESVGVDEDGIQGTDEALSAASRVCQEADTPLPPWLLGMMRTVQSRVPIAGRCRTARLWLPQKQPQWKKLQAAAGAQSAETAAAVARSEAPEWVTVEWPDAQPRMATTSSIAPVSSSSAVGFAATGTDGPLRLTHLQKSSTHAPHSLPVSAGLDASLLEPSDSEAEAAEAEARRPRLITPASRTVLDMAAAASGAPVLVSSASSPSVESVGHDDDTVTITIAVLEQPTSKVGELAADALSLLALSAHRSAAAAVEGSNPLGATQTSSGSSSRASEMLADRALAQLDRLPRLMQATLEAQAPDASSASRSRRHAEGSTRRHRQSRALSAAKKPRVLAVLELRGISKRLIHHHDDSTSPTAGVLSLPFSLAPASVAGAVLCAQLLSGIVSGRRSGIALAQQRAALGSAERHLSLLTSSATAVAEIEARVAEAEARTRAAENDRERHRAALKVLDRSSRLTRRLLAAGPTRSEGDDAFAAAMASACARLARHLMPRAQVVRVILFQPDAASSHPSRAGISGRHSRSGRGVAGSGLGMFGGSLRVVAFGTGEPVESALASSAASVAGSSVGRFINKALPLLPDSLAFDPAEAAAPSLASLSSVEECVRRRAVVRVAPLASQTTPEDSERGAMAESPSITMDLTQPAVLCAPLLGSLLPEPDARGEEDVDEEDGQHSVMSRSRRARSVKVGRAVLGVLQLVGPSMIEMPASSRRQLADDSDDMYEDDGRSGRSSSRQAAAAARRSAADAASFDDGDSRSAEEAAAALSAVLRWGRVESSLARHTREARDAASHLAESVRAGPRDETERERLLAVAIDGLAKARAQAAELADRVSDAERRAAWSGRALSEEVSKRESAESKATGLRRETRERSARAELAASEATALREKLSRLVEAGPTALTESGWYDTAQHSSSRTGASSLPNPAASSQSRSRSRSRRSSSSRHRGVSFGHSAASGRPPHHSELHSALAASRATERSTARLAGLEEALGLGGASGARLG